MKVSTTKEQAQIAREENKGLMVFGIDYSGGKFSCYGPEEHGICAQLMLLICGIRSGKISESDLRYFTRKLKQPSNPR